MSLSTVFIKQHSVLDVLGGLLFCLPLWFFIYGKRGKKENGFDGQK